MDWHRSRILITGASGFLGSHLTRRLVDRGAAVNVWTASSARHGRLADVLGRVTLSIVDIRDPVQVRDACRRIQPEVVYHLAAYGVHAEQRDFLQAVETNVRGTANLLAGLKGTACRLVVTTGTWAEYGSKDYPIHEREPLEPVGAYGATKAAATLTALAFADQERFPLVVLRPFSVYGPGEGGQKFVPSIIQACLKGENPRLSSGRQIRDYLYIDDVIAAYLKAADLTVTTPLVLNVASGVPLRLQDFASSIVKHFPDVRADFGALPDRDREIWKVQADITQIKAVMGWQPVWSLEDGIRTTVEWFRHHESQVD
jgi:nucleoside-diphosphate-sugar epimerase